jgi:hypothetical protein
MLIESEQLELVNKAANFLPCTLEYVYNLRDLDLGEFKSTPFSKFLRMRLTHKSDANWFLDN